VLFKSIKINKNIRYKHTVFVPTLYQVSLPTFKVIIMQCKCVHVFTLNIFIIYLYLNVITAVINFCNYIYITLLNPSRLDISLRCLCYNVIIHLSTE